MPPRAADKAYTRIQAAWLRRRRSSINEPIASTPSAMTGMTKRALALCPLTVGGDGWSHRRWSTLIIFPGQIGVV
jgi:hypothetical protein